MRYARLVPFAALILVAQSGCRTAGVDNLARQAPLAAKPQPVAFELVADHNRNAGRIETVSAKPSLTFFSKMTRNAADGNLALERPRNFRLEVHHAAAVVADIGSNDQNFWFWVKDNKDRAIYFCNYDDAGNTPLSPTVLQPDWINEALGLRVITETEASGMKVTRDPKSPKSLILTHQPTRSGDDTVTRVAIMNESTRRMMEYRLFAGQPQVLVARAVITEYLELHPEDHPEETVYLPNKLRLEWGRDRMEVYLAEETTQVNVDLSDRRERTFAEDPRTGYNRIDLAGGLPRQPAQAPDSLRETLPAPPTGIRLGEPAPLGVDGAMRTDQDPVALSAERTSLRDDLLGPALPAAPGPDYARPSVSSRWKAASTLGN